MPHPTSVISLSRPGRLRPVDLVFLTVLFAGVAAIMWIRGPSGADPDRVSAADGLFDRHATYESARSEAAATGKPVFVFATADWCGPCQTMKSTTLADAEVQTAINGSVVPYKLDVTIMENLSAEDGALADRLGVGGIPASYIITPDGQVTARTVGLQPPDRFRQWLASGAGG
ncbi:MAG: thioredoxin family protein [Phycisphaerales bacterium]